MTANVSRFATPPWASILPTGWKILPIKKLVSIPITDGPHETPDFLDEGVVFISAEAIQEGRIDFDRCRGFISEEDNRRYSRKYAPKTGDIYVVKSGATTGKSAIVGEKTDFNIWSPLAVVRSGPSIDKHFLLHAIRSQIVQDAIAINWSWGTQQNIGMGALGRIQIPVPDLSTQRFIAQFLDRETARIDQLITKKQRLMELLGEKLENDILRAVTLGIDPDVELVPEDELEWTKHRPKHWKLFRLKHLFRENTQYSKDGQETLLSLRMKEGLVPHNDVSDKEILPADLTNYKKVFVGQIVMNRMRAAIGLFGLADRTGIVSPDYSVFDVSQKAHAAYFLRLFRSVPMMAAFRLLSKGLGTGHSGFMRLNADNFGRIRVAVPELEEQQMISKHVEDRIAQIAELQVKNEQSINRLKEYRTTLITAAVTGQIDMAAWDKKDQTNRRLSWIDKEIAEKQGAI